MTEKTLVEDYITEKLIEKGWQFIPSDKLERDRYEDVLLIPVLRRALERINKSKNLKEEDINKVLNYISFITSGVEDSKKILHYYKFGISIKLEKSKTVEAIDLFDYENIDNNDFIISRQVYFKGDDLIRVDIILYINGIPLVNIECKNPLQFSEGWYLAYKQIKGYEETVPELYKYIQIGVAAESIARYFPIVPWQEDVKIYDWHTENNDSLDSIIDFLSPKVLLDIIKNFLFYREQNRKATKVIARYMQYRAVNKIVKRVLGNLKGVDDKNKGLIWHWQGSGKTLTMIFAANKLFYDKKLANPTIFFIVDRKELEDQLNSEINALNVVKPEVISSISKLKNILTFDDYRGKRGLFITLLHKFKPDELNTFQKELEEISKYKETILNRKNVIAFIDESHRTQYGLLASQMKSILKNAFFFAFTGTPISKKDRNTYMEFSYPPDELYLDRYFITDSIRDGFTVKVAYQPRLLKGCNYNKEYLDAFLSSIFDEMPDSIKNEVESAVTSKISKWKAILENPRFISKKAKDMADHFKENVDGRFKAMIVTVSRKACVLYKKEIDKYLPEKYSEIVMTYDSYDSYVGEYLIELIRKHGGMPPEYINEKIIEDFKESEYPKILIVTDMLLTGFDAPILQVMYLDKPLKEHRLLQAIARTNRPYKDLKEAGLIIDYIGILKEFEKSFELYNENDLKLAIVDTEDLEKNFSDLINEALELFNGIDIRYDRHSLLSALHFITSDKNIENRFLQTYKSLEKIYELLGSSELKVKYFEEYKWLSAVYVYYMKMAKQKPPIEEYVQKYFQRTLNYIYETTEVKSIIKDLPIIPFDENYLNAIENKFETYDEKVSNIIFTLNKLVLVERQNKPIYESLVEKVERLFEEWKEGIKDYKKFYSECVKIIKIIKTSDKRQKELGLSDLEYSLYLELENVLGRNREIIELIKELKSCLDRHLFPGWYSQISIEKNIGKDVRKFLRRIKNVYNLSLEDIDKLSIRLMEKIKRYGV